jgi:hypothetical protein
MGSVPCNRRFVKRTIKTFSLKQAHQERVPDKASSSDDRFFTESRAKLDVT